MCYFLTCKEKARGDHIVWNERNESNLKSSVLPGLREMGGVGCGETGEARLSEDEMT